jgi:6-phosphogluconolactonase (cycloisomerase 2 family)
MINRPVGLVAHPTADFLYLSSYTGVLTVFAIDSATGAVSQTSSVTLGNAFIKNSAVITPDGRYLYQNDVYPDDVFPTTLQIAGFSIDSATGALNSVPGSPLTPTVHSASSINMMAIDPTGKFLYAGYVFTVVNVGEDGGMAAYSIEPASGQLTAVPGSPFDLGGVPSSFTIDASGRFLVVSTYPRLGGQGGNCLAVLSIDPGTGALTSVPGSPFAGTCGVLVADPSRPYVYVGAGGFLDAPPAPIFVLSIDQVNGALAPIGKATIPNTVSVTGISPTH